jgi:hypothetical protein
MGDSSPLSPLLSSPNLLYLLRLRFKYKRRATTATTKTTTHATATPMAVLALLPFSRKKLLVGMFNAVIDGPAGMDVDMGETLVVPGASLFEVVIMNPSRVIWLGPGNRGSK